MKKIVEDLTPDQRETFRLHFFEGYTFTEIAEKLGQSTPTSEIIIIEGLKSSAAT